MNRRQRWQVMQDRRKDLVNRADEALACEHIEPDVVPPSRHEIIQDML